MAKWPSIFTFEGVAYEVNPETNHDPLYRFYNKLNGSHFYTASAAEKNTIMAQLPDVYQYEGVAYNVTATDVAGSSPVHRFYNVTNGSHFYTASEAEKAMVIARWPSVYTYEGIGFWIAP